MNDFDLDRAIELQIAEDLADFDYMDDATQQEHYETVQQFEKLWDDR